MTRKSLLVAVVVSLVLALTGCSGLQARGETAASIDSNALLATGYLADLPAVDPAATQPDEQVRAKFARNATTFDGYYQTATVNWFAYVFSKPTIFCTAKYYAELGKTAALADEISARASDGKLNAVEAAQLLRQEMCWFIAVKRAKDGATGP
jgi:hypothetical protein